MAASPPLRRRPPKVDTERMEAIRSSARHLKDLQRAHKRPPADVEVNTRGVPKFVPPIIEQSYCTSPAALCAELAEPIKPKTPTPLAELMEPIETESLCDELADELEDELAEESAE
ncbi:MAG TPA: hypothetical protein VGG86_13685 [Roseiarcus sp.]